MPLKLPKNIVLIGMRGTGKSAIGRTLAKYLGWRFFDVDKTLEADEKQTIAEIVQQHNWDYFRDLETKYVKKIAKENKVVIATGGGVVLRPQNIQALKKNGVVVLLHSPLEHLIKRVSENKNRPSLTGSAPAKELEQVWRERKELYEKAADCSVIFDFETQNKKTDLLRKSKLVLKAVKEFLKS